MAPSPTFPFNPTKDIPSLSGKTILVTGGTAGLGTQTILALIPHGPKRVYFSGRNETAATALIERINTAFPESETKLTFVKCDLASLASVKAAAEEVQRDCEALDVVFCNAGIMAVPPGLTKDGVELQFGTNHLGHALLVRKLMGLLSKSSDARVVVNTSEGAFLHPKGGIEFEKLHTDMAGWGVDFMAAWTRYGQSKLANVLFAKELQKRYPGVTSVAVHPGVIDTGLVTSLGWANRMLVYATNHGKMISEDEGVKSQLWCGVGGGKEEVRGLGKDGGFWAPVGSKVKGDASMQDLELGGRLWDWTEDAIRGYL